MKASQDAYGKQLLAQYEGREPTAEIVEREDGYIDTGSDSGKYFETYSDWTALERRAIRFARGRVLDMGCGAGRHALHLQQKGLDVTGIDNSPGAIKVCKLRGLKKALIRPIAEIDKFHPGAFDTILMLGNNFGLFGSAVAARRILRNLSRITSPDARMIVETRDPHNTTDPDHLQYHRLNKKRGRMPGQIRLRVRFGKVTGEWMDYLLVSPKEMQMLLSGSDWEIQQLIGSGEPQYFAIIGKKPSGDIVSRRK